MENKNGLSSRQIANNRNVDHNEVVKTILRLAKMVKNCTVYYEKSKKRLNVNELFYPIAEISTDNEVNFGFMVTSMGYDLLTKTINRDK